MEYPNGTPIEVTQEAVEKIETAFLALADEIETVNGEPLIQNMY